MAALKQKKGKISLIGVVLFLVLFTALPALAANGSGDGDGKGGGKGGLTLVSSFPQNNDKDVALPVVIKLEFSKNVVNMSVKENNLKCFSLLNSENQSIPIEVQMADDQMEPDRKREIVVVPKEKLDPGSSYTLKINANLTSKSGVNLGKDIEITFITQGESKTNVSGEELKGDNNSKGQSEKPAVKVSPENGQEASAKKEEPAKVTKTQDTENKETYTKEPEAPATPTSPENSATETLEPAPVTGEGIDSGQPEEIQEVTAPVEQSPVDTTDKTKSGNKIGNVILILIIIAAGGGFLIRRLINKKSR